MSKIKNLLLVGAMTSLIGCQTDNAEQPPLKDDVVQLTYAAKTNSAGDCTPFYTPFTNKNADGLPANEIYIIRGETEYFHGGVKTGEIPFQVKMYKENQGMPSEGIGCQDLHIKITIEACSYQYPNDRSDCPEIEVVGAELFAKIEIVDN